MSIAELPHITVQDPGGPWTRLEPSDVPAEHGLLALNCEYNPGTVSTRRGFAAAFNPAEQANSMFNWIFDAKSYLFYYNASSGKMRLVPDLANPIPVDHFTQSGAVAAQIASSGTRCYFALYDSAIKGICGARVTSVSGAAVSNDECFVGPLTTKPSSITQSSSGSITAGTHRLGYIVQTRSGYLGKISPYSSTTNLFDTTSVFVAPGAKNLTFQLSTTWPTEASKVWPVMTTVSNLNRYFLVPGVTALSVPGGSAFTITFTIDISDEDLASVGTDVTDNMDLLTKTAAGVAPFWPFSVGEYGFRTVYLTEIDSIAQAYISEPERPQHITADQHVVYLPGQRKMTGQFVIGKVLYIAGPNWTYAYEDTGDIPISWPSPRMVDGTIGMYSPRCATVNASQGFALVAHQTGFWMFAGGAYQTRAWSYYVDPDWKRINWAGGGHTVQVIDNKDKQQAYVLAPLDSATAPSHILMFDYSNGTTPEDIKYSLWSLSGFAPGSGCLVQNASTKQDELWIGKSSAGKVLRQVAATETTPYNDDGSAISWAYETALLPGLTPDLGRLYYHYAEQIRALGNGELSLTVYGMDRTKSVIPAPIMLVSTPGTSYTKLYTRLRSESASIRMTTSSANHWCQLSAIDHYYGTGPYKS